jgi:hypothetical protein
VQFQELTAWTSEEDAKLCTVDASLVMVDRSAPVFYVATAAMMVISNVESPANRGLAS